MSTKESQLILFIFNLLIEIGKFLNSFWHWKSKYQTRFSPFYISMQSSHKVLTWVVLLFLLPLINTAFVPGYSVVPGSLEQADEGIIANLSILSESGSPYGNDFKDLFLNITYVTTEIVRIQIFPTDPSRWRVPEDILKGPNAQSVISNNETLNYSVNIKQNPFSILITRNSDGEVIFNSAQSSSPQFNGLIVSFLKINCMI